MKEYLRKHFYFIVAIQIILLIFMSAASITAIKKVNINSEKVLKESIFYESEIYLKNTVKDTIKQIEEKSESTYNEVEKIISLLTYTLNHSEDDLTQLELLDLIKEVRDTEYGSAISVVLQNDNTSYLIDDEISNITKDFNELKATKNSIIKQSKKITIPLGNIYIYSTEDAIEQIVKEYIKTDFYNSPHNENEYMWVNEVLDYNGGEDYAIRVIHPNLKDTEGSMLSTDATDIKGNLPYLAELEGINESGEIFHSYYFKNKIDDTITEKLSYAKLYEPYDWIIAIGRPVYDIMDQSEVLNDISNKEITTIFKALALFVIIFLMLCIYFMSKMQKKYENRINQYIEQETERDTLTKVYTRKSAEAILGNEILKVNGNGYEPSLVMLVDIDDFKIVNDSWGHDVGDMVLQQVCMAIEHTIRGHDYMFRWGGDEFVLLFKNVDQNNQYSVADKILNCVRDLIFEVDGQKFGITISIGGSFFEKNDKTFHDTIKRADKALYQSKKSGLNKFTFFNAIKDNG